MLASFPASMLNQKPSDLGILNRFKLDPSRSAWNFNSLAVCFKMQNDPRRDDQSSRQRACAIAPAASSAATWSGGMPQSASACRLSRPGAGVGRRSVGGRAGKSRRRARMPQAIKRGIDLAGLHLRMPGRLVDRQYGRETGVAALPRSPPIRRAYALRRSRRNACASLATPRGRSGPGDVRRRYPSP